MPTRFGAPATAFGIDATEWSPCSNADKSKRSSHARHKKHKRRLAAARLPVIVSRPLPARITGDNQMKTTARIVFAVTLLLLLSLTLIDHSPAAKAAPLDLSGELHGAPFRIRVPEV